MRMGAAECPQTGSAMRLHGGDGCAGAWPLRMWRQARREQDTVRVVLPLRRMQTAMNRADRWLVVSAADLVRMLQVSSRRPPRSNRLPPGPNIARGPSANWAYWLWRMLRECRHSHLDIQRAKVVVLGDRADNTSADQ